MNAFSRRSFSSHNSHFHFHFSFPVLQHYLHEVNVLEQSIQKYESTLHCGGPLDAVGASYYTKHMLTRYVSKQFIPYVFSFFPSFQMKRNIYCVACVAGGFVGGAHASEPAAKPRKRVAKRSSLFPSRLYRSFSRFHRSLARAPHQNHQLRRLLLYT